ncbi:MAG: hypothetical protein ACK4P2_02295 [Hyphomonas sp.]
MGEGHVKLDCRLLGRSFFSRFSFDFDGFDFCVAFGFNGFDFRFSFGGFNSHFDFHDFGFDGRLTCDSGTSEKHCSGSADKQFRHLEIPSF